MHLILMPEAKQGLSLAKYIVNHPYRFKNVRNDDGSLQLRHVFLPFIIAMCQASIAITVEIAIMVFILFQPNFIDIICKLVGLTILCKLDDMYAASIGSHKIANAKGLKLIKYYFRRMRFMIKENEVKKATNEPEFFCENPDVCVYPTKTLDGKFIYDDPTEKSYGLKVMRFIYKTVRILFVSVIYYFMPFLFIMISFIANDFSRDDKK